MKISSIFSYLVFPSKHEEEQPIIGGANIPLYGKMFNMLNKVFNKADEECNIPICFVPENGKQTNSCLNDIVDFVKSKNLSIGRKLAQRMQSVTTTKSGLGLLFLILAENTNDYKLLISRFPADQGIIAEQFSMNLKVQFIEKIFLKNAFSYKAALYKGRALPSDFWLGNAVDKQLNYGARDLAQYWIHDFLKSDFKTTPKAGTKRLAVALKEALRKSKDLNVKKEITAAALLGSNLSGNISISEFCNQYNLSPEARKIILREISSEPLVNDIFKFSPEEFSKHISFKSIELNNGAILTAEINKFDSCFEHEPIENTIGEILFSTRGIIIDEKLKKVK